MRKMHGACERVTRATGIEGDKQGWKAEIQLQRTKFMAHDRASGVRAWYGACDSTKHVKQVFHGVADALMSESLRNATVLAQDVENTAEID